MKRILVLLLIVCFGTATAYSQTYYIYNVTIVDVINKRLIPRQAVGVDKGVIVEILPIGKIKNDHVSNIIDGTGKFLIPGMTDAHVHFFQSGGLYARPDAFDLRKHQPYENEIEWVHNNMEDLLRRYVQNGITSVIDVGGTYHFLQQKDSFQSKYYAPRIFMTGPVITGFQPSVYKDVAKSDLAIELATTPEEGRKLVNEQLPYHPDFIKIWWLADESSKENLQASVNKFLPIAKAIIDEAHKNKLKVTVHATQQLTARYAVENGADFLVHGIDDEIISDDFVKLLKANNVIDCPTLIVHDNYIKTWTQTHHYSTYDLAKANPQQIGSIEDVKHLPDTLLINRYKQIIGSDAYTEKAKRTDSILMVNLKKMIDGGVTIAAGTDAGNIGTQHAASYFEELLAMKQSGLSNWQILQAATINPAKILNHQDSLGSIAVGKKADLVLLNSNPVEDINNITKISLVINKGVAINPDTLIAITPETLVQQQVNGYNSRNIDAFLDPYADDVELYDFPDKLISKGKESMRQQYGKMFKELPNLHCEIKERIVQGNYVIDKEIIAGIVPDKVESVAIYEIKNGKIVKVYFIQ